MKNSLHKEIMIIGGGIAGASVAYHLSKLGKTDIAILERLVESSMYPEPQTAFSYAVVWRRLSSSILLIMHS